MLRWMMLVVMVAAMPAAQGDMLRIPLGKAVERVPAASDPTQQYVLYVPSGYDAERPEPVLFLMDPRGRAMVPMRRFESAAEAQGYVLISSYQTLSDAGSAFAVNARALTAMLRDVQVRLSVDASRFYLVGCSGTAHYAWTAAAGPDGHVAGLVSVDDGLGLGSPSVGAVLTMERRPLCA